MAQVVPPFFKGINMSNYNSTIAATLFKRINEIAIKYNDSKNGHNLVVSIFDFDSIVTADNDVLSFEEGKRQMTKAMSLTDYTELLRPVIRRDIATGEPELDGNGDVRHTSAKEAMECLFSCLREMQLAKDAEQV